MITRVTSTLHSLWDFSLVLLSFMLAISLDVLTRIVGHVEGLIYVKPALAWGVFLLILLDLVTGYRAAHKRGEARTSKALSRTFDKLISRGVLLVTVAVFANMFVDQGVFWSETTGVLLHATFFLVALTEVKSIIGNLTGDEERGEAWLKAVWQAVLKRDVKTLLDSDLDVPEEDRTTPSPRT